MHHWIMHYLQYNIQNVFCIHMHFQYVLLVYVQDDRWILLKQVTNSHEVICFKTTIVLSLVTETFYKISLLKMMQTFLIKKYALK